MRTSSVSGLLLSIWAAACSAAPAPAPGPSLELLLGYHPRAAIVGLGEADAGPTTRLAVALHDSEALAGTPLDTMAAAILADRGQPFRAGSTLLRGLSLLPRGGGPMTSAPLAAATGLVGGGFVTRIRASGSGLPELLALRVGDGLRLLLRANAEPPSGAGELVLLAPIALDDSGTVTLLHRKAGGERTVALVLTVGGAPAAGELAALQAELASQVDAPAGAEPAAVSPTELARDAVDERSRRGALLAVAASNDLPRCLDLLLCLEERQLITIAEALPPAPESSWQVERAFWTALLPALQRGEMPPAAVLGLRRHFGAEAFDPTALEFALTTSATAAAFDAALLAENMRALDDRRAKHRVTATGWLAARGHAVPDYDALAPRDERKAALARHQRQQQ